MVVRWTILREKQNIERLEEKKKKTFISHYSTSREGRNVLCQLKKDRCIETISLLCLI